MQTTNLLKLDILIATTVMGRPDDGMRAPSYSTWAAVGTVVEQMNALGYVLFCYASLDRTRFRAQFHDIADGSGWAAQGTTFPIAVCRAALAVFDLEDDEE